MRPRSLILLLLALGCGLVASVGISQVMDANKNVPAPMEMETILVAVENLDGLKSIDVAKVKLEKWPKDKIPKGALKELADVENRSPKASILAGEPILDAKLLKPGERVVASQDIPKGFRVIGVKVDAATSGGSLLVPGDKVDVVVYLENRQASERATTAKTILQNVKVFAVNQVYNAEQAVGNGDEGGNTIAAKTVSLLVKLEQAEKLALAEQLGKIELVIRGPEDEEVGETDGVEVASLFNGNLGILGGSGAADKQGGLFQFLTGKDKQTETPVPVTPTDEKPDWTMTLYEGPSFTEARFKDGKLMAEPKPEVAAAPPQAPQTPGAAPGTVPGQPVQLPGLPGAAGLPGGAESPSVPNIDALFDSDT